MKDVVEWLRELVGISSISKESNRGVIDFSHSVLTEAGWNFEEHVYRDRLGIEKVNSVAWPSAGQSQGQVFHLVLVCHTDTVPYAKEWTAATTLTADGENLRGCGACDVKGYLACILAVAAQLDTSKLGKRLGIILTADEEVGCVGARSLVDQQSLRANFAIVGEPTSLRPVRAGKGYCLAEITVKGTEAHSAFPENGRSAIYDAAKLIVEVEKISQHLKQLCAEGFSPPWTTINVGEIRGGLAKNIVPPSCSFLLEWRPIAGQDPGLVPDLVQSAISRLAAADPSFQCELKILRMQQGFATAGSSGLLQALLRASGNEADCVAFGTEAPWMNKLGAEAVVFGPGSMLSAHSPREYVPREELYRCVEILKAVVQDLCG